MFYHPSNFASKLFLSIAGHLNASPAEIVAIVLFYAMHELAHVELPWCIVYFKSILLKHCIFLSKERILEYKQRAGTFQTFSIIKMIQRVK